MTLNMSLAVAGTYNSEQRRPVLLVPLHWEAMADNVAGAAVNHQPRCHAATRALLFGIHDVKYAMANICSNAMIEHCFVQVGDVPVPVPSIHYVNRHREPLGQPGQSTGGI